MDRKPCGSVCRKRAFALVPSFALTGQNPVQDGATAPETFPEMVSSDELM